MTNIAKPTILTGLRANSELHLGNYLGGILPMVDLQEKFSADYQINMFVPDLHSFTTQIDHEKLYLQIIRNLKNFIASGLKISNESTYIYRQSFIASHSELAVILNNFCYYGELQRMTQFKDKVKSLNDQSITVGLFDYPVLMAADILLYGAKWVMVGDDQRQHLELARDLAARINNKFNQELFVLPATWEEQIAFAGRKEGVRIKSLRNPSKKMSKSIEDPAGTILLSDSPNDAAKKIMSATTDSNGIIHYDPISQPGISNLLNILALLIKEPINQLASKWENKTSYGDLKRAVAHEVSVFLTNFQHNLANIDEAELLRKLEYSEFLMRDISGQRLYRIQQSVGLRP